MSGTYNHAPAQIAIAFLRLKGVVSDPEDEADWPCYYDLEPDKPDNCVTVFGEEGQLQGRIQISGEVLLRPTFQVRVRCAPHQIAEGYRKAAACARAFDRESRRVYVPMGEDTYLVHSISRMSDVWSLGAEGTASRRRIFVVNASMSLRLLPGTGSYS